MENLEKMRNFKGTNEIKIKNGGEKGSNNLLQFSKLQTPNSNLFSKGITLIALVVTIVILLILAAITINLVLAEGGLFERAKEAEKEQEKAVAREKLELKLADLQAEKLVNNKNYNQNDYDYLTEELENSGFDVDEENGNFVTVDGWQFEIDRSVPKIKEEIEEEIDIIKRILANYTPVEIANDKDGVREIILKNPIVESVEYLTSSQEAMNILGKSTIAKKEIINYPEWCEGIANSDNRTYFSEYIVYNADTFCATAVEYGVVRDYYKSYDGFALSVAFNLSGSNITFISKDANSVIGYCTYNSSVLSNPISIEYNGETWYYATVQFGWDNGNTFTSVAVGKDVGTVTSVEEAVIYALNDFFGVIEAVNEILVNYTPIEIANNKDGVLEIILKNPTKESVKYITDSVEAMTILGENPEAKLEIMQHSQWCKGIANSENKSYFSEYIVYNANTLCATAGGRGYYKRNNGGALSVIYNINGFIMLFIGLDQNSVLGYCNYDSSYPQTVLTYEYNGQTWYYAFVPYNWNEGTTYSQISCGKDVGIVNNHEDAVAYALDDFFK